MEMINLYKMIEHLHTLLIYMTTIPLLYTYVNARGSAPGVPKWLVLLYNAGNAALNAWLCTSLFVALDGGTGILYPNSAWIYQLVRVHYWCKFLDVLDTVFIVLKGKWRQLSFLHLFHHSTIGCVWSYVLVQPHVHAAYAFGAMANSFIHALMYSHYAITGAGFRNPLKRYLTHCQMLQFATCFVQAIAEGVWGSSGVGLCLLQMAYMTSMLGLFYGALYHKRGGGTKKGLTVKKPLSFRIENTWYDATAFADRHPGGNIIRFYDQLDATDAFKTFHGHSSRAKQVLKGVPVKQVEHVEPRGKRAEAFSAMVQQWQDKGLYKSNGWVAATWAGTVAAATLVGYALMAQWNMPVWGGVVTGIAWAHCGFVQHHAGHLAFTGVPAVDWTVQAIFEGLLKGGSGRWWRNRHNKHHAMPNNIEHDGDLRTTPFFAWDPVLVKQVPTPLLKVQHLLFLPMLALYVPVFFVTTKLFVLRKRYWDEAALIVLHLWASAYVAPSWSTLLVFYAIGYALQGLYLGFFFSLSHFSEPRVNDVGSAWDGWQIETAANWGEGSALAEWASGFLNLQIEHHLVPQMPAEHVKYVVADVKQHAKAFGLKYKTVSFVEAVGNMLGGLRSTAVDELARRKKTE